MVEDILSVFPDAKIHSGYALIRCPYHADGKEHRPSMSILLQPHNGIEAGFCNCFACGKKTSIKQLFKDLGFEYIEDIRNQPTAPVARETLTTEPPIRKAQLPFLKSNYLEGRGISSETQRKFKIYEKDNKVHMPVFDREGFYLYDNARSTIDKRFFIESGSRKTLWGIEEIDLSKPVAVCESQIDALSFWEVGIQAVATLGADNIYALRDLKKSTASILLAFDPDDAGRRARDRAAQFLGKFRCLWLDLPDGVDVNQALQDIKDKKVFKEFMYKCTKKFVL